MAKPIFSNSAVTELVKGVVETDLEIFPLDTTNFPVPIVGEEFFMVTLVGACSNRVEVVRAIENCGDYLRLDLRGAEGTTPLAFSPGDGVYHSITAEVLQIIVDAGQWYLGPFEEEPITDNYGYTLREGHLYFDTDTHMMMVWDGSKWRPFSPTVAGIHTASYTWHILADTSPFEELPWPDVYGQMPIDLIEGEHVLDVHYNGSKLIEQADDVSPVQGDYTIDYDTDTITMLKSLQSNDVVEVNVSLSLASTQADFILRTETDASGYGFVHSAGEVSTAPDTVLPTLAAVAVMVDDSFTLAAEGKLRWRGVWAAGSYDENDIVTRGTLLVVATTTTTDDPLPLSIGLPVYAIEPAPTWGVLTDTVEVISGTDYEFLQSGFVTQMRVWVPKTIDHSFKIQLMDTDGIASIIYETETNTLTLGAWNVISIPKRVVAIGSKLRAQLVSTNTAAGAIEYTEAPAYFSGLPVAFATVRGYLAVGAAPGNLSTTAYGCELQFQDAEISADWDVMADSGAGGGSGGGSGPTHTVADVPPLSTDGYEGDLWFVRET